MTTETNKAHFRGIAKARLNESVEIVNAALSGKGLDILQPVLERVGRGSELPHWYAQLKKHKTLPNLDGKTIGSVVEMLYLAVLETRILEGKGKHKLSINPARGIDFPDLDLGIKSPSENYCTSEPFFSPYERLMGSEYDAIVFLTDYQEKKKSPPLKLQIIGASYLNKTEIADAALCSLARKARKKLLGQNETWCKKVFRFLAFANQSDWRANKLLRVVDLIDADAEKIKILMTHIEEDFHKKMLLRRKKGRIRLIRRI